MRAVLTYHSIDGSGSPISVDRSSFERHVAWLGSGEVPVISLDAMVAGDGGPSAVALTFDDAFANLADGPIDSLLARGLPATVFVVSEHAGRSNAWGGRPDPQVPTLPLLDWPALGRLAEAGIAIGSHTRTHPRLPTRSEAHVEDELAGSAERIERELGQRPTLFAYPFGATSPTVVAGVRRHYRVAVTTEHRALRPAEDAHQVPRLDAYYFRRAGILERWNSSGFRRGISLRRFARRLRSGLAAFGGGP